MYIIAQVPKLQGLGRFALRYSRRWFIALRRTTLLSIACWLLRHALRAFVSERDCFVRSRCA